jgi:hypothetical protein
MYRGILNYSLHAFLLVQCPHFCLNQILSPTYSYYQQHTTLHTTAGLLLKLSRVGPGQFLNGRPDAAGSGFGGPVGGTLSYGIKNIPIPQGSDWGHCPV